MCLTQDLWTARPAITYINFEGETQKFCNYKIQIKPLLHELRPESIRV